MRIMDWVSQFVLLLLKLQSNYLQMDSCDIYSQVYENNKN